MALLNEREEYLYNEIFAFAEKIFPYTRSITGDGVRQTLYEIRKILPDLTVYEVPSGTQVFDWQVPNEWNIRDAYVMDESGNRVIDWRKNNLHVVSYSVPVNTIISLEELDAHLYSLPEQPDAIPYITSYYQPRWGFCITHNERRKLKAGQYRVLIESQLESGSLTYGELIIPGKEKHEILLSTCICHPSMANNECSGLAVATFMAKWLSEQSRRRYTYRIVYVPETIGAIAYLSRNLRHMKKHVIAGFTVNCVGDDRVYSFMPSRLGNTIADKVALNVLRNHVSQFTNYQFLERGSDERQYCAPGIDLPVVSIMRSKYGTYPEYHTSLDNLNLISPAGLGGAYEVIRKCLALLESNRRYKVTILCEPQLGKRGLYPELSTISSINQVKDMMNLLVYCDGNHDLIDIADKIHVPIEECCSIADKLLQHGLLEIS